MLVGDDDMVTLEHTVSLFRAIRNSELAVVPGTWHLAAMEKPDLVNRLVLDFLQRDRVPTYMPLKRAADGANQEGWPCSGALNIRTMRAPLPPGGW